MSRKTASPAMHSRQTQNRQRTSWHTTSSVLLGLALALISVAYLPFPLTGDASAASGQSSGTTGYQRLAGQWLRPDGGYMLVLTDIRKDGNLQATYFNPRPINVARAEMRRTRGTLHLFVELQDVNYPGSKYNLQYDPVSDQLNGTYYQAVEKQTYEIRFVRMQSH